MLSIYEEGGEEWILCAVHFSNCWSTAHYWRTYLNDCLWISRYVYLTKIFKKNEEKERKNKRKCESEVLRHISKTLMMCFKYPGRKEATQRDPCNPPFHTLLKRFLLKNGKLLSKSHSEWKQMEKAETLWESEGQLLAQQCWEPVLILSRRVKWMMMDQGWVVHTYTRTVYACPV